MTKRQRKEKSTKTQFTINSDFSFLLEVVNQTKPNLETLH